MGVRSRSQTFLKNIMLSISNTQVRNISLQQMAEFKKRLRTHIESHFAPLVEKLNEEECQEFLEEGLRRTTNYRLQTENEVMQYFNIMLTLGVDFEFNEEYPWAKKILNDKSTSSKKRIQDLNQLVEAELKNQY